MKNREFIEKNIGAEVYITGDGDLAFIHEFRPLIFNETKLFIVKLTKNGMAYLTDGNDKFYSVPPRNVRLFSELV